MSFLMAFPGWKLMLLVLCLLFSPQAFRHSNHYLYAINSYVFLPLFISSVAILAAWLLIKYYLKNDTALFHKTVSFFARLLFRTSAISPLCFLSIFVFAATIMSSFFLYDFVPRVSDEIAQLFQAKIFLSGHLYAASPSLPEFFTYAEDNMIVVPKWYCQYPPGFPFLLMIGLGIGSPWIVNPLFAAFSVILVFLLSRELFGRDAAMLSAFLFALSPKVLFTSGSLMNHTAAMFFLLLAITTMIFAVKKQHVLLALYSGLSLGACLNIRTVDAVILFLPVGMYSLIQCLKNRAFIKIPAAWLCGFCIMAGILLYYNYQTNGNPLTLGYMTRWGEQSHNFGFHEVRGGNIHTPLKGLLNSVMQIRLTDKSLLEWPVPASFFILVLLLSGSMAVWDWLLISIILLNIAVYFLWGWVDPLFMGRYYFSSTPYLIMLVARGIICSLSMVIRVVGDRRAEHISAGALLMVLLFFLMAIPVRVADIYPQYARKDLQVDRRLQKNIVQHKIHDALVFIEPQDRHELNVGSGFFMNTLNLASQDIIFAKDLGKQNTQLLQVFKNRKAFLYRHRRDVRKLFDKHGFCVSPPEAFELIELYENS
jgi:hypothetical protein